MAKKQKKTERIDKEQVNLEFQAEKNRKIYSTIAIIGGTAALILLVILVVIPQYFAKRGDVGRAASVTAKQEQYNAVSRLTFTNLMSLEIKCEVKGENIGLSVYGLDQAEEGRLMKFVNIADGKIKDQESFKEQFLTDNFQSGLSNTKPSGGTDKNFDQGKFIDAVEVYVNPVSYLRGGKRGELIGRRTIGGEVYAWYRATDVTEELEKAIQEVLKSAISSDIQLSPIESVETYVGDKDKLIFRAIVKYKDGSVINVDFTYAK